MCIKMENLAGDLYEVVMHFSKLDNVWKVIEFIRTTEGKVFVELTTDEMTNEVGDVSWALLVYGDSNGYVAFNQEGNLTVQLIGKFRGSNEYIGFSSENIKIQDRRWDTHYLFPKQCFRDFSTVIKYSSEVLTLGGVLNFKLVAQDEDHVLNQVPKSWIFPEKWNSGI